MFGLYKFISGMVVGSVATLAALNFHLIRTTDSWAVVPKRHLALTDTYVDIRDWGLSDWTEHADLVYTLHKNGRQDLITDLDGRFASLKKLFEK